MRAFPGRILGYAVVWPVDDDTRAEMEWCAAHGFTGLKLHSSNGFAYTDPVYAGALPWPTSGACPCCSTPGVPPRLRSDPRAGSEVS